MPCSVRKLYLIEILHQTTTNSVYGIVDALLYLIEILHQTTTSGGFLPSQRCCILSKFYIKPQLIAIQSELKARCILSKFYIKPQLRHKSAVFPIVVSYRNSTSNHNRECGHPSELCVVSYRNSTSNHNTNEKICKAQIVVSYRNSTSNHNVAVIFDNAVCVVSYRNSTSNHNFTVSGFFITVLYLIEILHQTTTARTAVFFLFRCILSKFYIKPQLYLQ